MGLDSSVINAKHFLCANGLGVLNHFRLDNCVFSAHSERSGHREICSFGKCLLNKNDVAQMLLRRL